MKRKTNSHGGEGNHDAETLNDGFEPVTHLEKLNFDELTKEIIIHHNKYSKLAHYMNTKSCDLCIRMAFDWAKEKIREAILKDIEKPRDFTVYLHTLYGGDMIEVIPKTEIEEYLKKHL